MHILCFLGRDYQNRLQSYNIFFEYANIIRKICIFANIFVPLHPQMKQFVSKIWNSPSARNVGKLLSANVFAQAIGLLVYPVLTRLYTPEDFGLLNLFLSIGAILVLLSTSEYQSAVLLPAEEKEAAGVSKVAFFALGLWLLVISLSLPFSNQIARLFDAPAMASYYWLLIPYVAVMGGWLIYNAWLMRRRDFGRISAYQLNQSGTGVLTKLIFGWAGWLRSGLILSSVIAPIIALTTSIFRSRDAFRKLWQPCEYSLQELACRYRRFPLYSMPRSLVNTLSGNLPALLLTPYFGLGQLGFFAMATTLAFRPITMITSSMYQVLFERVAQRVREGQSVWSTLSRRWVQMAIIVIPIMALLAFIMPWLVRFLLGAGWEQTATLIRYMLPWITCVLMIAPLGFIGDVFGKQKLFLVIEIVYLGLRIGAMLVGIWMNSFAWAIILLSAAGTLVLSFQLMCYIYILRKYESTRLSQAGE